MKKIAEQYGGVIVAGIAFLFIASIFTSDWLNDGLKGLSATSGEDYSAYADAEMTHEILTTPKPVVALLNHAVRQGIHYDLNRVFAVTDHRGTEISFEILGLTDLSGNDILSGQDTASYAFGRSGTYHASILAMDSMGIKIYKTLTFPVQSD